jgi:putative SOS response-associated peptidase YedK
MRVPLLCEDESLTPWKSAKGEQHNPLTLLFRDAATEGKLRELVELRIEDEAEKAKWSGKCKDKVCLVEIHRFAKFNGIARIDGLVVEVKSVVAGK